jgi:small-conductance mechanosensitive channel
MQQRASDVMSGFGDLSMVELRLVETVVLLVGLGVLRILMGTLVGRQVADERARYHWTRGVTYVLVLVALVAIGRIWFEGLRAVTTFLGLIGAGLVIALKEPVLNMAGWFFMLWRRPFAVGDRIQVGSFAGDVIDQRLFLFSLLEIGNWVDADQSTGRIVHIPNGRVFVEPVANYTRDFPYLWNEVTVVVTFESNWQAARDLLLQVGQRHGRVVQGGEEERLLAEIKRQMIFYSTLAPIVYTSAGERGVVLALRYLCDARARRGTAHAIWEDVLVAFAARDDIDFAYPTRRFFSRDTEQRTLQPPPA